MRTLLLAGVVAVAATAPQAEAAPKPKPKPISKTYTATAPLPDPTNAAGGPYSVCAQQVPQSFHVEVFKAPAAGKLAVEIGGFQGDWDLLVTNDKSSEVAGSGNGGYGTPATPSVEKVSVKIKKAGTYNVIACNWAGTPTATVKYVFTYA